MCVPPPFPDGVHQISVSDMMQSVGPLFDEHRDEIATHPDIMVVNPDLDFYRELERQERLVALAAFREGRMIGYSVNILTQHPHYTDLTVGTHDLLFVSKPDRKTRAGAMLLRETERRLKASGAQLMLWHAKPNTDLTALLTRRHYAVQDIIFSKILEDL